MVCEDKYPGPYCAAYDPDLFPEPIVFNGELVGFKKPDGHPPVTITLDYNPRGFNIKDRDETKKL